jgi:hypothetical protein
VLVVVVSPVSILLRSTAAISSQPIVASALTPTQITGTMEAEARFIRMSSPYGSQITGVDAPPLRRAPP